MKSTHTDTHTPLTIDNCVCAFVRVYTHTPTNIYTLYDNFVYFIYFSNLFLFTTFFFWVQLYNMIMIPYMLNIYTIYISRYTIYIIYLCNKLFKTTLFKPHATIHRYTHTHNNNDRLPFRFHSLRKFQLNSITSTVLNNLLF